MNSKILACSVVFIFVVAPNINAVAPPTLPVEYVSPLELEQLKKMAEKAYELELRLKANEKDITRLKGISAELDDATQKIKTLEKENARLNGLAVRQLRDVDEELEATRTKLTEATAAKKADERQYRLFIGLLLLGTAVLVVVSARTRRR